MSWPLSPQVYRAIALLFRSLSPAQAEWNNEINICSQTLTTWFRTLPLRDLCWVGVVVDGAAANCRSRAWRIRSKVERSNPLELRQRCGSPLIWMSGYGRSNTWDHSTPTHCCLFICFRKGSVIAELNWSGTTPIIQFLNHDWTDDGDGVPIPN